MKNHDNGKKKLQQALLEAAKETYRLEQDAKEPISYSPEFEERMARLTAKKRRYPLTYFHPFVRRVAAIVLGIAMLWITTITIDALKGPHPQFISESDGTTLHLYYSKKDAEKSPETLERRFSPSYIPYGFVTERVSVTEEKSETVYKNVVGRSIVLLQQRLDCRLEIDLSDGELEVQELYMDDNKILICHGDTKSVCVWNNDEYMFVLYVQHSLSVDELQKIMFSLKEAP